MFFLVKACNSAFTANGPKFIISLALSSIDGNIFLNNFVGNSSIPSLIGKSSLVNFSAVAFCASVISFAVAFCVSVTGLNNLVNPV